MKNKIIKLLSVLVLFGFGVFAVSNVFAEEETEEKKPAAGTSIRLMPTSKVFQIASNSTYEGTMKVSNDGDNEMRIEVYSAPYSYVYSDTEDSYKLGFNNENNYTQISRWITIQDPNGNFVQKPIFSIPAHNEISITYRITTPSSIPGGGQYAVIFAHTLTSVSSGNGIRTEASPGLVIYGRSTEGEAVTSAEISDLKIEQNVVENGVSRNNFFASAKVKNTGNVDLNASGVLKVEPIIGFSSYETEAKFSYLSVIPEAELVISDEWKDSPSFGIYKATWNVTVNNETKTAERVIFLIPTYLMIIIISLLTIFVIWIIITIRKRKARRSRLAI